MKFKIQKKISTTRPRVDYSILKDTVAQIFEDITNNGDIAIQKYNRLFDGFNGTQLKVTATELQEATAQVEPDLKKALKKAQKNIAKFHKAQIQDTPQKIKIEKGLTCWQETRPIEKIGIYIPGGSAPLFSSVLMLGVPAKIAGCSEIVLCTPPDKNGKIAPEILYTAQLTGITNIYKTGGIQAIAAMSLGTESIPKVYKIFGPGNQYVTAAKQFALQKGTAIDLPAGPSELMVVADKSAKPEYVAADLLSQAEHGEDSQVVCLSPDKNFLKQVIVHINKQVKALDRQKIIKKSLQNAQFVNIKNTAKILQAINDYAPEHLILSTRFNSYLLRGLSNAGSVFIGNYAPESAGDYASGTNHTLPTNGFAKSYSGVNMESFVKHISFQKISKKGLKNIAETVETMASYEGLTAHQNAVEIRLKSK